MDTIGGYWRALKAAAAKWNKSLLDNSARPSGALVYSARDGKLTPEQYDRLKHELETGFQGAQSAGRPMLLEGDPSLHPSSLSAGSLQGSRKRPAKMTWTSWKPGRFLRSDKRNVHAAAREIALAIGVPPVLLGIPGDATYSNYQEANRAFYRQTVLPLVTRTARALTDWLGSVDARGGRLPAGEPPRATRVQTRDLASKRLVPDFDSVEALSPEREASCRRRASIEAGPPGKNILPHPRRKTRGHRL